MKVKSNLFSLSANLDSLLAAIIGFLLIQIFSKHSGIGVSPDSVTYLSASRHLIAGDGFRSFDNLPTVDFPFAYPFFLTVISFFSRLDPLQFGPVLNGLLFGILLYVSGSIINGFQFATGWYKRILLLCILTSPALQEVYSLLWSETLFLILILLFVVPLTSYLRTNERKWLFASAAICALVCITRYAGVFLILSAVSMLLLNATLSIRRRLMDCLIFGSISGLLFAINISRNFFLSATATGPRPGNPNGFLQILVSFGGVLCDWLLIGRTNFIALLLTVFVIAVFVYTIVFHLRRKRFAIEYVLAVTGLVYCAFMIFTSALTRYEQFTNRLLSPMFIPLLFSLSWRIPSWLSNYSRQIRLIGISVVLLVAAWFINIQLRADYEYYDGVKDAGVPGYMENEVRLSPIVKYLESNKGIFDKDLPIYSNAGDAVYFFTGLPASQLPFIEFPDKVKQYYTGFYNHRKEYLIWFQDLDNPEMPDLPTILKNKNLLLLKQLDDGAVYITF